MKRISLLLLFVLPTLCISEFSLPAQHIPLNPKRGAISDLELDMVSYGPDTSAAAVLLYRSVEIAVAIGPDGKFCKTSKIYDRWKVLRESGKDRVDYEIPYSTVLNHRQSVSGIKAVTWLRNADGSVSETKMSRKYIFDKPFTDSRNKISFAPENVREGAVVEVFYQVGDQDVEIGDVFFQSEAYPVNLMDLDVSYAEYFKFNHITRGGYHMDYRQEWNRGLFVYGDLSLTYSLFHDKYRVADLPVMKKDPFCYCPRQYLQAVSYEISTFDIPGVAFQNFSSTWANVDQIFQETLLPPFHEKYKNAAEVADLARKAGMGEEGIVAVWEDAFSGLRWNGKIRLIPEDQRTALKQGEGNSATLNARVSSALNAAGYVSEPVLVKTRSQGVLVDFHVAGSEFNTCILRITSPDGGVYYLNAADKSGYLNVLNPDLLSTRARILHLDGKGEWVDLSRIPTSNQISSTLSMEIDPAAGELTGNAAHYATGHYAYEVRAKYRSFPSREKWVEDIEKDEGIVVDSIRTEGLDSPGQRTSIRYGWSKPVESAGDFLYVRPFLSRWHSVTAFKAESRELPVEFPFPSLISQTIIIQVPEGYSVAQLPDNVSITSTVTPGSSLRMMSVDSGRSVRISYRCKMAEILIPPESYPDFRAFWEAMAGTEDCMVVFQKIR